MNLFQCSTPLAGYEARLNTRRGAAGGAVLPNPF